MALSRSCPLCSGVRARTAWLEAGRRYVRCTNCGAVFSDVDQATYAASAANVWHEDQLQEDVALFYGRAREAVHERFLSHFRPTRSGRLLDVGCGLGYFVRRAQLSGWEAYGCDTSPSWVAHARTLAGEGRIALGQAEPGMFGGGFEMVTSWDVLEHVHDPLPFLRSLGALLAPGGRLFIRTPNLSWVYPSYALRRWLLGSDVELGPLNHVVYYTATTLSRALRSAGVEPVQWPVLPPPQVGIANRDPSRAGLRSPTTRLKNLHAAAANEIARVSGGRVVAGADLDVVGELARGGATSHRL